MITEMQHEFRKSMLHAMKLVIDLRKIIPDATMDALLESLFDILAIGNRLDQPIINVAVKFGGGESETVKQILLGVKRIMSDTEQLLEKLDNINAQIGKIGEGVTKIGEGVTKIGGETTATLAHVVELQAIIDASPVDIDPEIINKVALIEAGLNNTQAGLTATQAIVDEVDALIPDAS